MLSAKKVDPNGIMRACYACERSCDGLGRVSFHPTENIAFSRHLLQLFQFRTGFFLHCIIHSYIFVVFRAKLNFCVFGFSPFCCFCVSYRRLNSFGFSSLFSLYCSIFPRLPLPHFIPFTFKRHKCLTPS